MGEVGGESALLRAMWVDVVGREAGAETIEAMAKRPTGKHSDGAARVEHVTQLWVRGPDSGVDCAGRGRTCTGAARRRCHSAPAILAGAALAVWGKASPLA